MLLIAWDEKKNVPLLTWQQGKHMEYVSCKNACGVNAVTVKAPVRNRWALQNKHLKIPLVLIKMFGTQQSHWCSFFHLFYRHSPAFRREFMVSKTLGVTYCLLIFFCRSEYFKQGCFVSDVSSASWTWKSFCTVLNYREPKPLTVAEC